MQILWTRCGAIMAASDSATMALVMAKDRRAIGGGLRTLIPYAPRTRDGRPGGNNGLASAAGGNCTVDTGPPIRKWFFRGEPVRFALPPSEALGRTGLHYPPWTAI